MRLSNYVIKNFKACDGRFGFGFSGQIAKNGVKVAEFENYGDGGSTDVDFVSKDRREEFKAAVDEAGFTGAEPIETAISVMVDASDGVKSLSRKMKKNVCVQDLLATDSSFYAYPVESTVAEDRFHKFLATKFPNGFVVLNDLDADVLWNRVLGWQLDAYRQMLAA